MVKSNDRHITALTSLPRLSASTGPVTLHKALITTQNRNHPSILFNHQQRRIKHKGDVKRSCFDILEKYFYLFLHFKSVQTRQRGAFST